VNIYVANLAITTTADDLRQLFEPYGAVHTIHVNTDRDTGRCKGFGFVEMCDRQAAQAAIVGLRGQEFAGRTLSVSEARGRASHRTPRQGRG